MRNNNKVWTADSKQKKPLRLLPGVIIVVLQWIARFVLPDLVPGTAEVGVLVGLAGGLAIIVWWAFFSRADRADRWGAVLLMIVIVIAASMLADESIRTGMQGIMFFVYVIPVLCLAFVVWAVASRNLSALPRRILMVATILLSSMVWTLLRSDGIDGYAGAFFKWRWSETSEERFLSQFRDERGMKQSAGGEAETEIQWPGFRGANRNAVVPSLRIETDWSTVPPIEMWRRPIGPGCSSFAVRGDLFYTQEQRGEEEIVSCYNLSTGELSWRHSDEARFWDSHAGAGPRATPTLSGGRVYTFGATGILNVLDAGNGELIWSKNAASEAEVELPGWGFSSSPLVVGDVVVVAAAGTMVAYDIDSGKLRWSGPDGGKGYSSPHLLNIDGIAQILMMNQTGLISIRPVDGFLLWQYGIPGEHIVQPAITSDGEILLSSGGNRGMRNIVVTHGPGGWDIKEGWESPHIKPMFNDFVIHEGHAYGFVGPSLACIDIQLGERKWRGGRYGGQLLLLADQDLLLVLSEKGELALVRAVPDRLEELSRIQALEGKTWNHPALVGDILLVRNTQEMAAFHLPRKSI